MRSGPGGELGELKQLKLGSSRLYRFACGGCGQLQVTVELQLELELVELVSTYVLLPVA